MLPCIQAQVGEDTNCATPPTGLVAWWRAQDDARDWAGANHGATGPGTGFARGLVGRAFQFTGASDSYVEVPDAPALRATNVVTIEFWVKRLSLDFAAHSADYILEKGGDWTGGTVNYGAALHTAAYNHCLHFTFAGGWRGGGRIADTTNWHHCAIVARAGDTDPVLYVDGVKEPVVYREGAVTISLHPSTKPVHLGAQLDPITGWFYYGRALVDELSIYNRALSGPEILAIYNAGNAGKCAPPPPPCVPPPTNLMGWWQAEGDANDPAGTNHGTLHPGASFAGGLVGQAFKFTGASDSYIEVPDSASLRVANAVTIEFWVKRLALGSSPESVDYVLEKGGDWTGGAVNYGAALHNAQYNHCLHFTFAGGWRGGGSVGDTSNWHHCAIVARHGDADPTLFVDGMEKPVVYREGAATIDLQPSTQPLHIGALLDPVTRWYYYGRTLVDELSIYDRALSSAEIQAIYNAGSAGKCAANGPPQANDFLSRTLEGEALNIPTRRFLLFASAPNGDLLTLSSVSSMSREGMPVVLGPAGVTYSPVPGYAGQDSFLYSVSDEHGGNTSATALVLVQPRSAAAATMLPPTSFETTGLRLILEGYPNRAYVIQRAGSLGAQWTTLGVAVAGDAGQAGFADTNMPPVSAYYRAVYE